MLTIHKTKLHFAVAVSIFHISNVLLMDGSTVFSLISQYLAPWILIRETTQGKTKPEWRKQHLVVLTASFKCSYAKDYLWLGPLLLSGNEYGTSLHKESACFVGIISSLRHCLPGEKGWIRPNVDWQRQDMEVFWMSLGRNIWIKNRRERLEPELWIMSSELKKDLLFQCNSPRSVDTPAATVAQISCTKH